MESPSLNEEIITANAVELEVACDIDVMKSKLHVLESKLNEVSFSQNLSGPRQYGGSAFNDNNPTYFNDPVNTLVYGFDYWSYSLSWQGPIFKDRWPHLSCGEKGAKFYIGLSLLFSKLSEEKRQGSQERKILQEEARKLSKLATLSNANVQGLPSYVRPCDICAPPQALPPENINLRDMKRQRQRAERVAYYLLQAPFTSIRAARRSNSKAVAIKGFQKRDSRSRTGICMNESISRFTSAIRVLPQLIGP
ncbi:hypothetical protein NC651_012083 [Populus alba x Populus x berolinensis]|nr:hypothetical protein NC651_012083 [Populus alba x Populus x berolinensis]